MFSRLKWRMNDWVRSEITERRRLTPDQRELRRKIRKGEISFLPDPTGDFKTDMLKLLRQIEDLHKRAGYTMTEEQHKAMKEFEKKIEELKPGERLDNRIK